MHPFFRNLGLGALVIAVGLIVLPTAHAKSPKIKICGSDTIFNNGSAGAVYTEKTKPNGEIMKTFSCVAKDIVHEAARRYNLLRCFYVNDNQDIFQLAEINLEPEDPDDPTSALEGRVKLKKEEVTFSRVEGDRVIFADPNFELIFDMNLTRQKGCGVH